MGIRWFLQQGRIPPGLTVPPNGDYVKVVPKIPYVPVAAHLIVDMMDAPDIQGTDQIVGFRIKDEAGDPVAGEYVLQFGAFDDRTLTNPSQYCTLLTATKGTILFPVGSAAAVLKIQTDSDAEFFCHAQCLDKRTIWFGCSQTFGSPVIHCVEVDAVTYS